MTEHYVTPPHAYVPGATARHPEDYFDEIKSSVHRCLNAEGLSQTDAFITGLRYIDEHYYWEAHEVLEPVWMALATGSDERHLVQALIQLANAHLKQRMDRPKATRRLCTIAREHLSDIHQPRVMAVDVERLRQRVRELEQSL